MMRGGAAVWGRDDLPVAGRHPVPLVRARERCHDALEQGSGEDVDGEPRLLAA